LKLTVSEPLVSLNPTRSNGIIDLGQLVDLPVTALVPAPDNPRRGRGKLNDLAASIASVGVLQPLLVTPDDGGRYRIVCGERRWAAAVRAGLESVPCVVCVLSEIQRHEAMLIENLQRSSLSKMDEAQAYARLLDLGLSQRDIASRVGRSQAHISRRIRLLTLPDETRTLVDDGELPLEHALGYRSGPPTDLYGADEQLQRAWMALRAGVIESGDDHLIRLLRTFAAAHAALFQMART
jgi:ParB family chromosome partitioning protein